MFYLERKEKVAAKIKTADGFTRTVMKERWRGIQCSGSREDIEALLSIRKTKRKYRITEVED